MRSLVFSMVTALLLPGLSVPAWAQQTGLELIASGPTEAVVIRGDRAVPVPRGNRSPAEIEMFSLPEGSPGDSAPPRQQRVVTSANRLHYGRVTISADGLRSRYEHRSPQGAAWSVELPGILEFFISNDGRTVVGADPSMTVPTDGKLHVLGQGGRVVATEPCPFFKSLQITDGKVFAVSTAKALWIYEVLEAGVRRTAELPRTARFALSARGEFVASAGPGQVRLYRGSTLQGTAETTGYANDLAFGANDRLLAIAESGRLRVLQTASMAPVFSVAATERGAFRSVDLDDAGTTLVVGQLRVDRTARADRTGLALATVSVLDGTGQTRETASMEVAEWGAQSPGVQFFPGGRRALAVMPDAVYQLNVPGAGK